MAEDLSDKMALVLEYFLEEACELTVLKLVVNEVENTLWRAVKRGFVNLDEAAQKFSYFLGLRLGSIELDEG